MRVDDEVTRRVLDVLRTAPEWRDANGIATAADLATEQVRGALFALDVAGWLEVRSIGADPFVILSPLGAERMGLELEPYGASYRWVDRETARWNRRVAVAQRRQDLEREHEERADPSAYTADDVAAVLDQLDRPGRQERPAMVVRSGLSPWRELRPGDDPSHCPLCWGRKLPPGEYCLPCDRSADRPGRPTSLPTPGHPKPRRKKPPSPEREKELARLRRERERADRAKRHQTRRTTK